MVTFINQRSATHHFGTAFNLTSNVNFLLFQSMKSFRAAACMQSCLLIFYCLAKRQLYETET